MVNLIWCGMIILSVMFSAANGKLAELSSELFGGAVQAIELCLSIGGMICLWSGIMRILEMIGATSALSRLTRPLFKRLYPVSGKNNKALEAISGNFAANFLGIGNAATPYGIKAADMISSCGDNSKELSTLIVMNTASVQLLPTTICAVCAANGASAPYDILPAVWISSILSVTVGLICVRFLCGKE